MSAQEDDIAVVEEVVDSLYREDQVYVGVTFNLLGKQPSGFEQNGLSAGIQVGFIRDIPFNKRRNKAFGIGAGLAIDTYNQNLFIQKSSDGSIMYNIIDDTAGEDLNRFTTYTLEFPFEYRWRTSTPTKYSFWRIHAGVRLGYIFSFNATYQDDDGEITTNDLSDLNRLQYGPTFSFGYGAFNFQAYYGMNSLFKDSAGLETEDVDLQVIRLGLVFYFL